jgi:hypothetical protein
VVAPGYGGAGVIVVGVVVVVIVGVVGIRIFIGIIGIVGIIIIGIIVGFANGVFFVVRSGFVGLFVGGAARCRSARLAVKRVLLVN